MAIDNWQKKVSIMVVGVLIVVGATIVFLIRRERAVQPTETPQPQERGITLTPEEKEVLARSTTATGTPTLSPQQKMNLIKKTVPASGSKPTLSEEEKQKLIQSMSGN